MKKRYHLLIWPSIALVVLDQISKAAVIKAIEIHGSVSVIHGFFQMVHVRNRGMAFGLMNRADSRVGPYLLAAASIVTIAVLIYWFMRRKDHGHAITLALSFILGGAVGNLIDRVRFNEVVDFLDFYIGSYHWPAFNIADAAITAGTFLLAFCILFQKKE